MIKCTLEMAGNKYEGKGQTIGEAMTSLPLDWTNIKGKGVLSVTDGKNTVQKIFYLKQMRRLFGNKLGKVFRTMWANRLALQLTQKYDRL